jgi:polar amino acid transport system substrate-binding protein
MSKTVVISVIAALVVVVTLIAMNTMESGTGETRVVRIGTEGAYPPFNYIDEKGELRGFDIEIAQALCAAAKLECVFVAQDWDGLIPGLLARRYDAIVASMSITEERKRAVAFTKRYYRTPIRFVAPKQQPLIITEEGLAGKVIGAQRATTSASYLEERFGNAITIKLYDTQENATLDLQAGRVDALLADALIVWDWINSPAGQSFEFRGETIYVDEGIGIALRKQDTALLQTLNTAIDTILNDGTYNQINARYFPFSIY